MINLSHREKAKNLISNLGQTLFDNRVIIILLIAIFILAVGVRSDLMKYPGNYLFEPDASYHARMIQELVETGSVPQYDPQNYYQSPVESQSYSVYWFVSAWIYQIMAMGQPFNKDLLLFTVKFFPAIFGALISIILYFLAKAIFNSKKVALITAFVTAVTPAFVYRTMSGAQGDNSFGFLWMVIGFYFLVKAVKSKHLKKEEIINALLAGLFFGLMSITWQMYILIPAIVIPYALAALIIIASKAEHAEKDLLKNEVIGFALKIILSFTVMTLIFTIGGNAFNKGAQIWLLTLAGQLSAVLHIDYMVLTGLILIGAVIFIAIAYLISLQNHETKKMISTAIVLGLYLIFFALIALFLTQPDVFYAGEGRTTLGSMVGEESVGNSFFGTKYNALIVFPWMALILLPIGFALIKKEDLHTTILFWTWVIVTLFMAWYKLKFTFVFGLAIAPAAAIVAFMIFEMLKNFKLEKGFEAKITIFALLFIILLGVGATARFIPDYAPFPNQDPATIERMNWIIANTPTDAKFFNWWNDGHVLALTTERRFSTDNRNASFEANQAYARFVISIDSNNAYYIASQQIGADYILLESDLLGAMSSYEDYNYGQIAPSSLRNKYSVGSYNILICTDKNTTVDCGGNSLPKAQFLSISTKWKSTPDAFPDGTNPVFYYRTNDQILVLNKAMNNTNFAKVFTNSDETSKYYEEVYSSNGYKIYKILK